MRRISNFLNKNNISESEFQHLDNSSSELQSQINLKASSQTVTDLLAHKLSKPSSVITVGASNCDFTSLAAALDGAVASSVILIYAGTYTGPFNIKPNQSLIAVGRVNLVADSSSGFIFLINGIVNNDFHAFFYGDFQYTLKYGWNPVDVLVNGEHSVISAFYYLHGVIFTSHFWFTQSSTNNPTITGQITNFDYLDASHPITATRSDVGCYTFFDTIPSQILTNQHVLDILLNCKTYNRVLSIDFGASENWELSINSVDFAGVNADNCSGVFTCNSNFLYVESA